MNIAIRNIQKYLFNWMLSPETEFMVAFAEEETAILTISRVFFVENSINWNKLIKTLTNVFGFGCVV